MTPPIPREIEDRVLVLLPSERDGARTAGVLARAGVRCSVCASAHEFCLAVADGAGAGLLTERVLLGDDAPLLAACLREQPPWSALPLVVLTSEVRGGRPPPIAQTAPNITLIERPVRIRTLVSVVRSALRARRHQYEIRDSLIEIQRQAGALAESEARLGLAITIAELGSFEVNLDTDEVWINERGRQIYGWAAGEPVTYPRLRRALHPEDHAWVSRRIAEAMSPGGAGQFEIEHRIVRADGAERWLRVRGIAERAAGDAARRGLRCVGTFLDVTESRRAEQRLRESEARFRTLVEQVKDYAIFSTDVHGRVQTWNEGVQRVLGYSELEFMGLPVEQLFTPEDRAQGVPAAELAGAAADQAAGDDRWMLRKDGARFFATGVTTALRNRAGELVGFTKVMCDHTDWKLAQDELARHRDRLDALVRERTEELEQSMHRLRTSERMAALGTLSAGLGHDMGNLLLPVRMRIDSLAGADLPADLREDVQAIRTATDYLQRLANGLRLLAQDPDRTGHEPATELRAWWHDAQSVLRNALPRGIALEHRIPERECWVRVPKPALTQAVFNLVQNAGDAMRARGHGAVRVWAESRDDGSVAVGVADDGPGMTAEVRRRCLEPFFTTKTRGISTGLGLALVYGVVENAGGAIEIRSAPGAGATFILQLPAGAPESARRAAGAERRTAVVDVADARLRSFIEAELRSMRYEVLPRAAAAAGAGLWVVDDRAASAAPEGAATVELGATIVAAGNGAATAGARPSVGAIRDALRRAAVAGGPAPRTPDAQPDRDPRAGEHRPRSAAHAPPDPPAAPGRPQP